MHALQSRTQLNLQATHADSGQLGATLSGPAQRGHAPTYTEGEILMVIQWWLGVSYLATQKQYIDKM